MKQSDNKDNNYVNNNYIWLFVVLVLVAGAIFYLESIKPAQKFSAQVSNSSQSVDQALKNLQYPKAP